MVNKIDVTEAEHVETIRAAAAVVAGAIGAMSPAHLEWDKDMNRLFMDSLDFLRAQIFRCRKAAGMSMEEYHLVAEEDSQRQGIRTGAPS